MKEKIFTGLRIVLGLIFLIFGSNGLLMIITGNGFIPMPPPSPGMAAVMGGIVQMVYLLPLVKIIEVVASILLLANRYTRFALTILAPVVVNILGVHLFVDQGGLPMGIVLTLITAALIIHDWDGFRSLLEPGK